MQGKIDWFSYQKRFGFVKYGDNDENSCFLHINYILDSNHEFKEDDLIEFDLKTDDLNRSYASNVKFIGKPE